MYVHILYTYLHLDLFLPGISNTTALEYSLRIIRVVVNYEPTRLDRKLLINIPPTGKINKTKNQSIGVLLLLVFSAIHFLPRHTRTQYNIPVDKEWLGEVVLNTDSLVMYVVVICIV